MSENNFIHMTDSEDFSVVNHNELNYDKFKEFSSFMDERFSKIEKERSIKERAANVKAWDSSLPKRWQTGSLSKISNPAASVVIEKIKEDPMGNFFIKGPNDSGKTFLSYAIIRRYIGVGWVSPSQVKIISENELLANSKQGFQGQKNLEDLMSSSIKLYFFEDVGNREIYDTKESTFWEQMISHIYKNELMCIFTSLNSAASFSEKLSDSSKSKFARIIENKIVEAKGRNSTSELNDWDDKDLKAEKDIINEGSFFDGFES